MRFKREVSVKEVAGHRVHLLIVSINPAGQTAAHNKAGPTYRRGVCVPEASSLFAIKRQCCLKDIKNNGCGSRCGALVHYDVDGGGQCDLFKVGLLPLKPCSANQETAFFLFECSVIKRNSIEITDGKPLKGPN